MILIICKILICKITFVDLASFNVHFEIMLLSCIQIGKYMSYYGITRREVERIARKRSLQPL